MKRIWVAAVGIPALLFASVRGGVYLWAVILVLQIAALVEWKRISALISWRLNSWSAALLLAATDFAVWSGGDHAALAILLTIAAAVILCELFLTSSHPLFGIAAVVIFLFYIALPLALWHCFASLDSAVRFRPAGPLTVLLIATWFCDSAAYYFGRSFGRHKLFPAVSPNKTWEGAIAGALFASVALWPIHFLGFASPLVQDYIAVGIVVGVFGQMGDLLESSIKRQVQIKDSSAILSEHGGILDRFDSLLISTPLFLAYLLLFPH